jgi:hypothetical protein
MDNPESRSSPVVSGGVRVLLNLMLYRDAWMARSIRADCRTVIGP